MPRSLLVLPLALAAWMLTVAASPTTTTTPATPTLTPTPTPTHAPTPSPTPDSSGQLSLSPSLGAAGTTITVQGTSFRPGEQITLYWDSPSTPLGPVTADGQGALKVDVKAPAGDLGQHSVCAVEPNQVCAIFKLEAAPTPTPTPSPSDTPTPGAAATPAASAQPTVLPDAPAGSSHPSAVSSLLSPPFVIFPILVVLALVGGCAYWIWLGSHSRRRPVPATVTHRSVHPMTPPALPVQPGPLTAVQAPPAPPSPPTSAPDLPIPRPAADDSLDQPQPGD
jgi:nitrate reductase NapE component